MTTAQMERLWQALPPRKQRVAALFMRFLRDKSPGQLYFWTPTWQQWEREAEEDIRAGRVKGPFKTTEETIHALEA